MAIARLWLLLFVSWGIFLTGVAERFGGPQGIAQYLQIKALADQRAEELSRLEDELERVETEAGKLERSRTAQVREIRRVLGYAGPDDLVIEWP